jgi:hypothetical protein
MTLQPLLTVPETVRQAAAIVTGLDRCFLIGFGRLGPDQHNALKALERIYAGTPLGGPVTEAVSAIARSEFVDRHFAALASARAALQGAQYDALRAQADEVLGRTSPPASEPMPAPPAQDGPVAVWQESARNWLMELALAGFQQLEAQTVAPFASTLEHLQGEPRTVRLAAILTGFLNELLDALPVSALPAIPLYRWCDLWTRSMIGAVRPPLPASGQKVDGTLTIFGADLRQSGFVVSCDLYGLLEGDQTRIVRLTLSAFKVSVISGADLWSCFPDTTHDLLKALSDRTSLTLKGVTLLPTGQLLWDGKAVGAKKATDFQAIAARLTPGVEKAPQPFLVDPLDRHPLQLAEPIFLDRYQATASPAPGLDLGDGVVLPIAVRRLGRASELQPDHVTQSKALLGLLRFDAGQWEVQPLGVILDNKKSEVVFTGSSAAGSLGGKAAKTLATLRERASRLLRQKS